MKPILFNTEMVQAILEGRKTVTRRVVKLDKFKDGLNLYTGRCALGIGLFDAKTCMRVTAPPYAAGDILYVRETWRAWSCSECEGDCVADNGNGHCNGAKYLYKADGEIEGIKWKPSIHMPKAAARIFLKVTDVRVEQLQDMTSKEDFKKEGIYDDNTYPTDRSIKLHPMCQGGWTKEAYKERFEMIWNSTLKKDQLSNYGWAANPYVWVIEFERISKEEAEHGETN